MARIRSIKPEFWSSESITNLSREARLVYIGLWCFADDEGRFRAQLGVLAGQLFPEDDDGRDVVERALAELTGALTEDSVRTHGALSEDSLRERKGKDITQVSSPLGLGRGSGGRGPSELAPVDNSGSPAPSADAAVAHPTEADGAETSGALVPVPGPRPAKSDRRGRRLPDGWAPTRTPGNLGMEAGHDPAWLERELDRFRDYWAAQPGAKGRKSDWDATWRNWLRRADDYEPLRPRSSTREGPDWDRLMARAVAADAADARALDGGAA